MRGPTFYRWFTFSISAAVLVTGIALLSSEAAGTGLAPLPDGDDDTVQVDPAAAGGDSDVVERLDTWAETKAKATVSPVGKGKATGTTRTGTGCGNAVQTPAGQRETPASPPEGHTRHPLVDRCFCVGIEALLLAMAVAAPWGLGGVAPEAVVGLNVGLGLVLALWAARIVVSRRLIFRADAALAALGGLALLAALQLLPLPPGALAFCRRTPWRPTPGSARRCREPSRGGRAGRSRGRPAFPSACPRRTPSLLRRPVRAGPPVRWPPGAT